MSESSSGNRPDKVESALSGRGRRKPRRWNTQHENTGGTKAFKGLITRHGGMRLPHYSWQRPRPVPDSNLRARPLSWSEHPRRRVPHKGSGSQWIKHAGYHQTFPTNWTIRPFADARLQGWHVGLAGWDQKSTEGKWHGIGKNTRTVLADSSWPVVHFRFLASH